MNGLQKGADGFQLKLFALFVMTLDHIHYFFPGMPFWLTCLGRLAAPIFLFLCVEGFGYTRSRPKYLLRMYLFSVGMKLASMTLSMALPRPDNVSIANDMFSTMFVVCWCIEGIELLRGKGRKRWPGILMLVGMLAATAVVMAAMMLQVFPLLGLQLSFLLLPNPFTCEGSIIWVVLGIAFFYTRASKKKTALVMAAFGILHLLLAALDPQTLLLVACTTAAVIPICLYNGRPGKYRCKWLFYGYYPAHVYLLYLISLQMV